MCCFNLHRMKRAIETNNPLKMPNSSISRFSFATPFRSVFFIRTCSLSQGIFCGFSINVDAKGVCTCLLTLFRTIFSHSFSFYHNMNDSNCTGHSLFMRNNAHCLYISLLRKRKRTDAIHWINKETPLCQHMNVVFVCSPKNTHPNTLMGGEGESVKKTGSESNNNKKIILHTKRIKILRQNEIIYHFPCGRVVTDPFLNRLHGPAFILLDFLWHSKP